MNVKEIVRKTYAGYARGERACCDPVTAGHYTAEETAGLPPEAVGASLGCGNPVALAALLPGQTVLDLGSGAGLDVLLAARRVGPGGRVYGLEMTDEMRVLARENAARAGAGNVEFLRGELEAIPLPDASVDVILSNCVINLSPDKPRALREAFRVLRAGGRLAVHDILAPPSVPEAVRRSQEAWAGCVAGALEEGEYRRLLAEAGFVDVEITRTRTFPVAGAEGTFASAFVRAAKP
jgi:SAM-dependent methyltransferase